MRLKRIRKVTFGAIGLMAAGATGLPAQSVDIDVHDAIVWSTSQTISGQFDGLGPSGMMYVDSTGIPFETTADSFSVEIHLGAGSNLVYACGQAGESSVCSDTLVLTLGYSPKPEVFAWATVDQGSITLHAVPVEAPRRPPVSFYWSQDVDNPTEASIVNQTDSVASVIIPAGALAGEYYFDVEARDSDGVTGRARTFVTVTDSSRIPFDIWSGHAAWIDSAIIYEVTPYNFVANGELQDVRKRLSELADLGVNTLWIQPLFETHFGGQGYDVTNYFKIRSDYGNSSTLRTLITVAHNLGMKVILDFVPNHTSIHHPYAEDAIRYGPTSHYFDFYQRKLDSARYSADYHQRTDGLMTFTYYFWTDLINLNYNNPEVKRWMTEAGQFWIEEFDVDGYRIDAVWGVNARTPEAMQEWRFNLKRIKPEILLLGEDKATRPESFDKRFDVAYDWYPEEGWVSHWTWQYDFSTTSNPTIFNHPNEHARSKLLRDALTNRGQGFAPNAVVLRFMENNDTFRFAVTHKPNAVEKTRMASTLLFALPGIPLLYNGQEIGFPTHPYQTFAIYDPKPSMARQDRLGLYAHYRYLAQMRGQFPALTAGGYEEVSIEQAGAADHVFSFIRSVREQHVLVVMNMGDGSESVSLDLAIDDLDLPESDVYVLTSLMTGAYFTVPSGDLGPISVELPAFFTDAFVISNQVVNVSLPTAAEPSRGVAVRSAVHVYPNPFESEASVRFEIEQPGHVRLSVYDLLGRLVETIIDGDLSAGDHRIPFHASNLAAGPYLYRLETPGSIASGVMIKTR